MGKKTYRCETCGRKFSSKRGLTIHKSKLHKKEKKKIIITGRHFTIGLILVLLLSILLYRLKIVDNNEIDSYFLEICKVSYHPQEVIGVTDIVTNLNETQSNFSCQLKDGKIKKTMIDHQEYVVYEDTGRPLFTAWERDLGENKMTVHSPSNRTYQRGKILFNVSFKKPCIWIKDKIDDGNLSRITCRDDPCIVNQNLIDEKSFVLECEKCYGYSMGMVSFERGTHKVNFKAKDYNGVLYEEEVIFTVR